MALHIDIETRSGAPIKDVGLYRYAMDPEFEVLLFAYKYDDEPTQLVRLNEGESIPTSVLIDLADTKATKKAFNAAFEWFCLNTAGYQTPLSSWECTQAHALYAGYPGSLAGVGDALNLSEDEKKLKTGKALIQYFSVPQKPTKANGGRRWNLPEHDPERARLFGEYCMQDVDTEYAIDKVLDEAAPWPEREITLWRIDVTMNARGIPTDTRLVDGAVAIDEMATAKRLEEAKNLTGLANPKSNAQLMPWLNDQLDIELDNLRKETVKDLLDGELPPKVRRVLELKQQLSKTSVSKFGKMQEAMCLDGRIRGVSQYYGAHTGRYAGRLVQMQNLTKNKTTDIEELNYMRDLVRSRRLDALQLMYGDTTADVLSSLVRTSFVAGEGARLIVADFHSIEAAVIGWVAGEQWVNEVFQGNGLIYEATAAQMFGVPANTIVKGHENYALRQKGKVATLALGYQGGVGALEAMGALKMGIPEDDLPGIVEMWRNANPNIVRFWYAIEKACIDCMTDGRARTVRCVTVRRTSNALVIDLPVGRSLYYVYPSLKLNRYDKPALHYWAINTGKWTELETYGGKLTENIVQAIARDCLADVLIKLTNADKELLFHVHDEVIIRTSSPRDTVEGLCEMMGREYSWAPGLKLSAAGYEAPFYMKD